MNKKDYNVIIIGCGFSGMRAANLIAGRGLSVLLIDENSHLGGQLLREFPGPTEGSPPKGFGYAKKIGFRSLDGLKSSGIEILRAATVIGIYPEKEIVVEISAERVERYGFEVLLVATGARERFIPFEGWTLPGVYSTGMAQVLMKSSGILPARSILVGGSGLFLFSMAYEFIRNGGKVLAIFEETGMVDKVKLLSQFPFQFSKFTEGARFLTKIYLSMVPVKYRRKIVAARGRDNLEEVVVEKVDHNGRTQAGSARIYPASALAVGYGFVPNIEVLQMAGCGIEYDIGKGGFVAKVNDKMETTVPDIYAAGEVTGIAGALKSFDEGEIAGYGLLRRFEFIDDSTYDQMIGKWASRRIRHLKFGEYFNRLYRIPDQALHDIPDETIICRCENVTMKEIREAIENGYSKPLDIKSVLRNFMGNCQGRICGPVIYDLLSALGRIDPETEAPFTVRPPLKPVRVDQFISE